MRHIVWNCSNFDIVFTVIADGGKVDTKTIGTSHPMYKDICSALQAGDKEKAYALTDVKQHVETSYGEKGLEVKVTENQSGDMEMEIGGHKVTGEVAKVMVAFKQAKLPLTAIVKFWKKFISNKKLAAVPEYEGTQGLLRFIQATGLYLLPNGNFLAFKGVNNYGEGGNGRQFRSQYDNTFIYELDKPAVEPRAKDISDIYNNCGVGLHAGSHGFAQSYGHHRMLVEIDPSDVVTIPKGSDGHLRAWRITPRCINPNDQIPTSNFIRLGDRPAIVSKGEVVENAEGELTRTDEVLTEGKLADKKMGITVRLMNQGVSKIGTIKVVREITGMGLAESKAFVESAPVDMPASGSIKAATETVSKLTMAGATAIIVGGATKDKNVTAAKPKDKKRDRSAEKQKTRWYRLVAGKILCERKVVCPGPEWSSDKAAVIAAAQAKTATSTSSSNAPVSKSKKAAKPKMAVLKGAGIKRTYYRVLADGVTVETVRADKRPPGFTGERPKWFTKK